MTTKNQFLAFVNKNIEDFTPQQMEAAIRLLNGKDQPSLATQRTQSAEQNKTRMTTLPKGLKPTIEFPVFDPKDFDIVTTLQSIVSGGSGNLTTNIPLNKIEVT